MKADIGTISWRGDSLSIDTLKNKNYHFIIIDIEKDKTPTKKYIKSTSYQRVYVR